MHAFGPAAILALLPAATALGMEAVPATRTIEISGASRAYFLHSPSSIRKAAPLVVVLHGNGQTPQEAMTHTGFVELADKNAFHVVFPAAREKEWAHGGSDATRSGTDVQFLTRLIDKLVHTELVDAHRVFITGADTGGMLALRMACEAPELIAAAAPIISAMPCRLGIPFDGTPECTNLPPAKERLCKPARAVPLLFVFGDQDEWIPAAGGPLSSQREVQVFSAENTVRFWKKELGCSGAPRETVLDRVKTDQTRIVSHAYECPLEVLTVAGGGHTWPQSRHGIIAQKILGPTTQEISSETIWKFLARHKRP